MVPPSVSRRWLTGLCRTRLRQPRHVGLPSSRVARLLPSRVVLDRFQELDLAFGLLLGVRRLMGGLDLTRDLVDDIIVVAVVLDFVRHEFSPSVPRDSSCGASPAG